MHEVESMFSVKLTPWHGLGAVLQNPPTSGEAIVQAGLAWDVEKRPLWWKKNNGSDALQLVENRVALVRASDESILSVVSTMYEPLQNRKAFEFFDPFIAAGKARYETAGSLRQGQKIWILARLNDGAADIGPGDEVRPYLLLTNGHDGKHGVTVMTCYQRVVCANTLALALGEGGSLNFVHVGDVAANVEQAKEQLGLMVNRMGETKELFYQMRQRQVTADEVDQYLRRVTDYQAPVLHENEIAGESEAVDRHQVFAKAMYDRITALIDDGQGTELAGVRGSLWGLYNATCEFADWYLGNRATDRANYMLFGAGQAFKERAMAGAVALLGR